MFNNIDTSKVLDKEMDRKQFLKNVGIGAAAFVGLTAVLRVFEQDTSTSSTVGHQSQSGTQTGNMTTGYGGSVYGR